MNSNTPRGRTTAAYGAAVLFALHLLTYFIPSLRDMTPSSSVPLAEALALLAVVEHLLLLPVIAALPAPSWARAGGYGWLVLDIATDIMQVNGAVKLTYLTLRYGANIAAALWIASASWRATRPMRVIGVIVAFTLVLYAYIAFLPWAFLVLVPSLFLLPLWLFLVGRFLSHPESYLHEDVEGGEKHTAVPGSSTPGS